MGHHQLFYSMFGVQKVYLLYHVKFILANMLSRRLVKNESDDLVLGNLQFMVQMFC